MNIQTKINADGFARSLPASSGTNHRVVRRGIYGSVAAILLIGALTAYWVFPIAPAEQYITATASTGSVTRVVSGSGTVNPVLTIIVGSYVSGVIKNISCDFNTKVRKGQLCAKIDPGPYQTAVDQAVANLATAKAQLAKDQANFAYTQSVDARDSKLLGIGGVSQEAADVAKNANEQAKAQIAFDEASIKQHEAALRAAQVNLDYTNIVSPVDGTVVSRNVTVGQTVAASFQTPTLFLIATDLTRMQVDANISESDIGAIRPGNKTTFTVEAFPDRIFQGSVTQVRQAPQTVQNVVTYDVVIDADNNAALLKPGMTATARIVTEQRQNVVRVPDQALRYSPAGAQAGKIAAEPGHGHVWALRYGVPLAIPVGTGLDDDTYTEITDSSVTAGETLIIGSQPGSAGSASTSARPRLFGF